MNLRDFHTPADRRRALEKVTGVKLEHIGKGTLDESVASTHNCENMIGVAQVPLGIAGPLKLQRLKSQEDKVTEYFIPLATTEGALVASVNRGSKAITQSGGAVVHSHRIGATRGPVFYVQSLEENTKLYEFLETHIAEIKKVAEETSHHLTLKKITSRGVGKYRYVRFVYDTQDAMGLNMVTIASDAACGYITRETGAKCLALSGNFCVDKKPSWQNFLMNRGIKVWAEVTIPADVLRNVLKTTATHAYDVWYAKCMLGSVMSGSMGFNAQFANVVAALYLATGQDVAHVSEGSVGITTTQVISGKDLYVSIYLPDLMVGTVGGGTGLATQQEALRLLGVAGGKNGLHAQRFAEIIGGAVLAGELSLLSSLEEGTLARAHQALARGTQL